jgi:hypothetical protein
MIFNDSISTIQLGKDSLFNKWYWENWLFTCRRLKIDPNISPSTSINSKWIKDLHVIHKTLKRLKENIQRTLENIGIGNAFLNRTLIAHEIRVRIDKCD